MPTATAREQWAIRRERGAVPLMRLVVWIALRVGRPTAQWLLLPACAYYFLFSPRSRAASLAYLARVLGRRPTAADRWRHYHCFATCLLDRVLLLNDRIELFDVTVHGENVVKTIVERGDGAFLFGAHLGSFEVVRAAGRLMANVRTSLVMYEDNARKTNAVLQVINPARAVEIIGLGRPGSMLAVKDRLDAGHLVGILADRSLETERRVQVTFLGTPAWFPFGPFRMAALLRRPVVLMLGLHRGGRRYDIVFETISADPSKEDLEETARHYVARLEYHCRRAPYNWFNFYDFWA
jgi:predicted LPLAT superfamily acyltransferase